MRSGEGDVEYGKDGEEKRRKGFSVNRWRREKKKENKERTKEHANERARRTSKTKKQEEEDEARRRRRSKTTKKGAACKKAERGRGNKRGDGTYSRGGRKD